MNALTIIGFVVSFACGMAAAVLLARDGYPWLSFVVLLVLGSIKMKSGQPKKRA